jgi:hypothetical protein
LYKFLGYLFSSAQGADVLNQIASHSFENLGYAFANFCYDHINTAYVRYKAKDNPFNGFKEKADYTSSFAWSEWEKFLDENAFDLNSEFYVSLLFSHVDSSWLEQNSYSNSFCSYINSSQYMGIVEKGYSVYKEKGGVSNIVDSLVDLLEKMPSRSKKHKYSRRDREGVIKRILQKDFILDNEAFSLLEYIIDEARKDNDLGDVPDILLDNEKFLNNKKAFMKLWDVFGSGHNFREKVAGITIMPEEVYDHLSQSKSDKVQNALAPKHEITFIK